VGCQALPLPTELVRKRLPYTPPTLLPLPADLVGKVTLCTTLSRLEKEPLDEPSPAPSAEFCQPWRIVGDLVDYAICPGEHARRDANTEPLSGR
jgi:hypothetical protein